VKMKNWKATARRWMNNTKQDKSHEQRIGRIAQDDIQSFINRH